MVYNADCLASNRDPLGEQIDGAQLRHRYLERLLELERQGRSERQMVEMVLPPNKTFRIKRRHVPEDMPDDEPDQNQRGAKRSRRVDWMPPSHLGPQTAWIEERNSLAAIISGHGYGKIMPKHWERAEELLQIIEAIGCEEVMTVWNEAVAQTKSLVNREAPKTDSTAQTICQLVERAQVRSFQDKVVLRIGKWVFSMKILQDIEGFRKEGAPSKQSGLKPEADSKGNAVTRAHTKFLKEAHPEFQDPTLAKEWETKYLRYRDW